ncbi:MAG: CinA family nicotinamide mononucleotide deamidase-related protein [Clostridiales bacterium]|nr:CinA family nicotinamide mononucleotide deamidase-related protein [Clostridiales bacterium]
MRVSIIAIGDELLLGNIVDTNTPFMASLIDASNWQLVHSCQVHDEPCDILFAIKEAMRRSDVVLTTGGLGPTKDDITKQVMCEYFGGKLIHNDDVAAHVERIFSDRGLPMNALTASQAMVPDSCMVIPNATGTAPVMWFEKEGKVLVSMPGVPREMRYTFTREVLPRLRALNNSKESVMHHRYFLLEGISESAVDTMLSNDDAPEALHSIHKAYLPQTGYLKIRLDSTDEGIINRASREMEQLLGQYIFAREDVTPAEALIDRLKATSLKVSSAESCTGGNIAHMITSVAGSSAVYNGSVVSYSNDMKIETLGVSRSIIDTLGAVSEPVAQAMAQGVANIAHTECAISTSGIAGPGGATPGKPVGTVCIGVKSPFSCIAATYHFTGNRAEVIERASIKAIILLLRQLSN